jgi:hypothetical protein
MSVYYPEGCSDNVGQHVCSPCPDTEQGRISSVAFIKTSFVFVDPTDSSEWDAGIASGDIKVLNNVNGTYDGGTTTFGRGYGRVPKKKTGKVFKAPFFDPNLVGNDQFYIDLSNSLNWRIALCGATIMRISDSAVTIDAKDVVEEPIDSEVVWNVEVEFTQKNNPLHYDIPVGIFSECYITP